MCVLLFPPAENGEHAPSQVVREAETSTCACASLGPRPAPPGCSANTTSCPLAFSCFSAASLKMFPGKGERGELVRRLERVDVLETPLYLNVYQAFPWGWGMQGYGPLRFRRTAEKAGSGTLARTGLWCFPLKSQARERSPKPSGHLS